MNGQNNDGVLVSLDWLRRVDAAVFRGASASGTAAKSKSLFHDVRPARIVGEWSRSAAGAWTAKANFIVGDAVDASFEFDVAAPLAFGSETAPTAADATAFVVWRGRWELLTAPSASPKTTSVVYALTPAIKTAVLAADATVEVDVVDDVGLKSAASVAEGGQIPYIAAIECVDGKLVVTTRYLSLDATKTTRRVVDPTATVEAITGGIFPLTRAKVVIP